MGNDIHYLENSRHLQNHGNLCSAPWSGTDSPGGAETWVKHVDKPPVLPMSCRCFKAKLAW